MALCPKIHNLQTFAVPTVELFPLIDKSAKDGCVDRMINCFPLIFKARRSLSFGLSQFALEPIKRLLFVRSYFSWIRYLSLYTLPQKFNFEHYDLLFLATEHCMLSAPSIPSEQHPCKRQHTVVDRQTDLYTTAHLIGTAS